MRILIDATSVLLRSAGIKTYTYYWVQHLWQQAGNEQIHTFPRLGRMSPLDHEKSILTPFETYRRLGLLYMINTSAGAPMMRWMTRKADVFHVSNQIRKPPKKVKLTATIHDMTSLLMPELHTPGNVRADASFTENVLKRADRLIAVSENTRADAIKHAGLDADRMDVIYSGVPEVYFGAQPRPSSRPYILYVGTIEPRKNIDTLLDAWQGLRLRDDYDLLIAGATGWSSEKTMARLLSRPPSVRYLAYLPEDELPGLTAGATAFLYPSLYEGFGFPVAQPMAAGVPVITSNTSSLPEIAGDAALLVDPRSPAELAAALERLLTSPSLAAKLGASGLRRAAEYRWDI